MAYSEAIAQKVREELLRQQALNLHEIKMYGGLAFMVNDKMCVVVGGDDGIMVRVGRERYDEALARPGALPSRMRDRPVKGYVDVTPEGQKDLAEWVRLALAFNGEMTGQEG